MADPWVSSINGDEDEDEALRIAIALSLGEDPGQRRTAVQDERASGTGTGAGGRGAVIDLTLSDDEDGDVAVRGSGRGSGRGGSVGRDTSTNTKSASSIPAPSSSRPPAAATAMPTSTPSVQPATQHPTQPSRTATPAGEPASVFAALGLDRRKMEEERLARIRKRKAAELGAAEPTTTTTVSGSSSTTTSTPSSSANRPAQRPRLMDDILGLEANPWFVPSYSSASSSSFATLPSDSSNPPPAPPAYKGPPAPPPSVTASDKVIYANLPYSRPPPPPGAGSDGGGLRGGRVLGSAQPVSPASEPVTVRREGSAAGGMLGPTVPAATSTTGLGSGLWAGTSQAARGSVPFPRGLVKKTWAFGQPRRGDDIKIEEVLQKGQLQLAVLSSYQWDEEWLLSKIDISRTKLILVAYAADEIQQEQMRANVPRERIRFCFPPMGTMGSMHSKLMILKFDGYIRIVVPTGNLMSYDWGETGTMENMVFLIDLPKLQPDAEQKMTPFADELLYFLGEQGLDDKLIASLRHYDFSETARYQFVHTIAGTHGSEDAWKRTGYCGLGRAVCALGLSTSDPIDMDIVCASLGNVNNSLITALYHACQGDSGLKEYELRTSKGQGRALGQAVAAAKAHTRIFFPSLETVAQSKGGKDGAGTICFQSKWWQASTFPKELLRDCKNVRPGVLMHSKMIFVRPSGVPAATSRTKSFAYVGSANLSESAWGRLVKDANTGRPKMTCRNWECGVLIPVGDDVPGLEVKLEQPVANSSNALSAVFDGRVPVPMEWPGRSFAAGGGGGGGSAAAVTPWFYSEN
ncbi:hypothetical protein VTJ04DRAFT_528 [Mycothermus thermophilus]|uniref:uncharacterized protein n=1 Tax=Humicola insolens TaxID=85995 RepID=UPI0037430B1B